MQSKKNFLAALPLLLTSGLLPSGLVACTGSVEGPAPAGLNGSGGAPLGVAGAAGGSSLAGGASGSAGSTGGAPAPPLPVWTGNVGSWCGPGDSSTLWLVAKPQAGACEAASKKLYSEELEDTAEGLALELDPAQLTTFPAELTVPARYCGASAGSCADVQVALNVESYAEGQGAQGTWAFSPPGQAELKGRLEAGWCSWDDFLPAHPEGERLARDIAIREVAVYQGVKVPIARDMLPVTERNADLVQQREAMVRVFVAPRPEFQSRELTARVTLQDGAEPPQRFEQTITVSGASMDNDGASTFNLALPKEAFKEDTRYSVELRETSKCTPLPGTPGGARFPETGMAPVGARFTGPVKVLLVPVRYEADGSNRMPDMSPAQLQQMTERLYAMYPTSEVVITVRDAVGTDRTSLGDMLDQMRELRNADDPPSDLSYYGMVRQAETFRDYCNRSCTTGIAAFGSQNGTSTAGMGIGFIDVAAGTFVHELGHIYRRPHAPCGGAAGTDEAYPYPEARLGAWGYNIETRELFDPERHVDFMSYCSPEWISDYNYQLLLERIIVVNQRAALRRVPAPGAPKLYRSLLVDEQGRTRWGLDLRPKLEPPGDPMTVEMLDAQGGVVARVTAYQELTGEGERAIFVPAAQPGWHAVRAPGVKPALLSGVTRNKPFRR